MPVRLSHWHETTPFAFIKARGKHSGDLSSEPHSPRPHYSDSINSELYLPVHHLPPRNRTMFRLFESSMARDTRIYLEPTVQGLSEALVDLPQDLIQAGRRLVAIIRAVSLTSQTIPYNN